MSRNPTLPPPRGLGIALCVVQMCYLLANWPQQFHSKKPPPAKYSTLPGYSQLWKVINFNILFTDFKCLNETPKHQIKIEINNNQNVKPNRNPNIVNWMKNARHLALFLYSNLWRIPHTPVFRNSPLYCASTLAYHNIPPEWTKKRIDNVFCLD